MICRVLISVTDWDGDDIVLVDRAERATLYDEEDYLPKLNKKLATLMDEATAEAGEQAMAIAEQVKRANQ